MNVRVWWAGAAMLALSPLSAAVAQAAEVRAVASFTLLADVVSEVGGDRVEVSSLIGPNGDPHAYEPTPNDVRRVRDADVVFMSGLGLEGWMGRLIEASGFKGSPVVVSDNIHTREMGEDEHGHGHDGGDGHGDEHGHDDAHGHDDDAHAHDGGHHHAHDGPDPHVWNDPSNVEVWVDNIVSALSKVDPAGADAYRANGDAYKQELASLDDYARAQFEAIPEDRRRILTSHDAFGYLGDRYGVTFLSPLGTTTDSEASARDVAGLITQMREEHIGSYFLENTNDPRLVEQIARATDARPGGTLYVGALSDADGPAPTYVDMFRFNVDQLAAAMQQND
ncbi:metal ABC transporter solute-binding protein, Zn/Mn family [Kushneria indalinina]|uniref:Zinc/manganese transport system substrate-binding protein n=1 Tax=Kushneria indalinina DSM 14324 TaxID=1122140 RepID=A0A3D9DX33_9GAMM|nr:zinc ABC transporter substrate-binding protein [Kushneria indalinina]REC95333.1 zinc/manganese transport system substrate-binding protein [Kushneria indalinina DSM 14324]